MTAALLALVLLAATVDTRLAEPLRLLAEVGARDGRRSGRRTRTRLSFRGLNRNANLT